VADSVRRGQGWRQVGAGRDLNCDLALDCLASHARQLKLAGGTPNLKNLQLLREMDRSQPRVLPEAIPARLNPLPRRPELWVRARTPLAGRVTGFRRLPINRGNLFLVIFQIFPNFPVFYVCTSVLASVNLVIYIKMLTEIQVPGCRLNIAGASGQGEMFVFLDIRTKVS